MEPITRTEDIFSAPTDVCPHPGYWHGYDTDSTEVEVTELVAAFVRTLQPEFVIETGTAFGYTAAAIGMALKLNGHGTLITLEPDTERCNIARTRCADLPVSVIQTTSLAFIGQNIRTSLRRKIGFAWLDSLLEIRQHELDMMLDAEWFTQGAVIGVHDTAYHHGIREEFECTVTGLCALHLPTPRGVTFLQIES
jgi:predicted O-methyltransferase YrrM